MKKILVAGMAVLAIAGSTAVYAQHRGWDRDHGPMHGMRLSPEDRLAFVDARIAAVKAGLKLTPDQDRLWPAIEDAVRAFAKQRFDHANASTDTQPPQDPVARLRERADRMTTTAAGLKAIADAADPLYRTLDEGQKRRLAVLTHMGGHHGEGRGPMGGIDHDMMGRDRMMDRDHDRGPGRGIDRRPEHDDGRERL